MAQDESIGCREERRDSLSSQEPNGVTAANDSTMRIRSDPDRPDNEASRSGASSERPPHFLARHIPFSVRRVWGATKNWVQGPQPPQIHKIRPFFPRIQTAPIRLLHSYLPKRKHRLVLLLAFYFCWLLVFVTVVHHSAFSGSIEGYGNPTQISCGASYWASGNGCGVDGNGCRPFANSSFAFRCPGNCLSERVLNPYAVGAQELIYQPLVVGGPADDGMGIASNPIYRGDSFLCSAAIHAGVVTNKDGGCAVVRLIGQQSNYPSTDRNGIRSVAFDSTFPLSYTFLPGTGSECKDLRWPLLAVSVTFTSLLSLFTASPSVFFGSNFVGIFFHVGLGSDPPGSGDYYTIISILLGCFLPAAFIAFVLYRYCIRRSLDGLTAQIEKTVLWLGACWVGALTNYTFDFIPIQRLTPHDLDQQPGAKAALAIIVLVVFAIILGQIWYLRLEGRLPRYLALYVGMGVCLGLAAAIPGLQLRIHHYILGILLLPGTAIQTRPSLLYQGLLVGFFINGVARWGFDSILQTPAALLGDGVTSSPLPTVAAANVTANAISFSWASPATLDVANSNGSYDGVSVLVNDVERYEGYADYDPQSFNWTRPAASPYPYYFRFAFLQGASASDYTKAGIWQANGSWTVMQAGPSRRG